MLRGSVGVALGGGVAFGVTKLLLLSGAVGWTVLALAAGAGLAVAAAKR